MASKPRLDIMVDLETLHTDPNATIIQIGVVGFDIRTGKTIQEFNEYANISLNKALNVSGDTLKFWLKTNPKLLLEIITKQEQSSDTIVMKFYNWIKDLQKTYSVYFWGNGLMFDGVLIETAFRNLGLKSPFSYRQMRDVRTLLEFASVKSGLSEKELKDRANNNATVEHDALEDCKYQINYVVKCYNYLIKKGE